MSDLERALDFLARADMAGSRTEPFRFGTAVLTPELPLRYDSNYLVVESLPDGVSAAELADEAERVQGSAGLGHRLLFFRDAALGKRLAPDFAGLGWEEQRHVVMVHRRRSERRTDITIVREVAESDLRPAREAVIRTYPWGTPEVAEQLLDAKRLIAVEARFFAVVVGGSVATYADLYLEGDVAQIEDVATVPERRGRGYASAIVLRVAAEARAAGAELVFLVADAGDWPKELYRRLGFDEVGEYVKLLRPTKASGALRRATGSP
jgi:N-acetylglutamate synthase-like GNAT family acetyltransferase